MMSTKGKMYQPHNVNDILVMSHFLRMQALWLWTCVGKCPGASTELLTQGCLLPEERSVVIWHGYQEVPAIFLHVTTCSLAAPGSGAVSPSWSRWCSHTSFSLIFFIYVIVSLWAYATCMLVPREARRACNSLELESQGITSLLHRVRRTEFHSSGRAKVALKS